MRYGFYLPTRGEAAAPDALEALVTRGEACRLAIIRFAHEVTGNVSATCR